MCYTPCETGRQEVDVEFAAAAALPAAAIITCGLVERARFRGFSAS